MKKRFVKFQFISVTMGAKSASSFLFFFFKFEEELVDQARKLS